jgi:hypothetical protein
VRQQSPKCVDCIVEEFPILVPLVAGDVGFLPLRRDLGSKSSQSRFVDCLLDGQNPVCRDSKSSLIIGHQDVEPGSTFEWLKLATVSLGKSPEWVRSLFVDLEQRLNLRETVVVTGDPRGPVHPEMRR